MKHTGFSFLKRIYFVNLKGDSGVVYIILIMVLLIALAGYMSGGLPKFKKPSPNVARYQTPQDASGGKAGTALQMNAGVAKQVDKNKGKSGKNTGKNGSNPGGGGDSGNPGQGGALPPGGSQVACSNIAVDFLVDESASMLQGNKMTQVKNVLQEYIRTLPPGSLVAIQSFSEPTSSDITSAAVTEQPFTEIAADKSNLGNIITKIDTSLNPRQGAATYMREGFKKAQTLLSSKRPGYKYYLVVISDGVPELDQCDPTHMPNNVCAPDRNYDYTQDPTSTRNSGGNLASTIKTAGTTIYTVGVFTSSDQQTNPQLETLLTSIASSPGNYQKAGSENELTNVFTRLAQGICPS